MNQREEIVVSYNKLAMEQLQQDNFSNSLTYLKQALISLKSVTDMNLKHRLMAITFNNLGCFFKRSKNFPEALKYLEKAVELEHVLQNEQATIAGAYLNMCSIYSQQEMHSKALTCGLKSIFLLKTVYKAQPRHLRTLVIAYHNVAAEYRSLGETQESENCLKSALALSSDQSPISNLIEINKSVKRGFEYFSRLPVRSGYRFRPKSRGVSEDSRKTIFSRLENSAEKKISRRKSRPHRFTYKAPRHVELQQPFTPNIFNENSVDSIHSFVGVSSDKKKIDIKEIRETEKIAAIKIQSSWRGFKARQKFETSKIESKVKKAEKKARKAVEEYEKLKIYAEKIKGFQIVKK